MSYQAQTDEAPVREHRGLGFPAPRLTGRNHVYSRPPDNNHQQPTLTDIASRVEAASGLLRCSLPLMHQWHRGILDMAGHQLSLCVQAIHAADRWLRGEPVAVGPDLQLDIISTDSGSLKCPWTLLDGYVATRLNSLIALISVIEGEHLDSNDRPFVRLGDALFECLLWLKVALNKLTQVANQPSMAAA